MADPKNTSALPKSTDKGLRSSEWNGEWFPFDKSDPIKRGFYRDTNGQWWSVTASMDNITDLSPTYHAAIVMPNNRYGRSPGWETGTFSTHGSALDGIDAFAIQARVKPAAAPFPWWLVVVVVIAMSDKRKR